MFSFKIRGGFGMMHQATKNLLKESTLSLTDAGMMAASAGLKNVREFEPFNLKVDGPLDTRDISITMSSDMKSVVSVRSESINFKISSDSKVFFKTLASQNNFSLCVMLSDPSGKYAQRVVKLASDSLKDEMKNVKVRDSDFIYYSTKVNPSKLTFSIEMAVRVNLKPHLFKRIFKFNESSNSIVETILEFDEEIGGITTPGSFLTREYFRKCPASIVNRLK